MEDRLDLVLKELKKIFNQIDEKFEQIDKRFEQIDKRFEQIDKRLNQIDNRLNQIDNRFEQIDKHLNQIDNRLNSFAMEMNALNKTFFKFETENQKNVTFLFEADEVHKSKELLFENQLYRLTDSVNNISKRVSILENVNN